MFGRRAGRSAAERVPAHDRASVPIRKRRAQRSILIAASGDASDVNTAAMIERLQATMADDVGPFRTEAKLKRALAAIDEMTGALGERPIGDGGPSTCAGSNGSTCATCCWSRAR